jgi:hypothetical protein
VSDEELEHTVTLLQKDPKGAGLVAFAALPTAGQQAVLARLSEAIVAAHQDNPARVREDKDPHPFVIEQFIQFNEHRRQVNSFSWQIPTVVFASLVFILGLSPDVLTKWRQAPWIPTFGFLLISYFVLLIIIGHERNRLTRHWLDDVIQEMERMHGNRPSQYGYKFGEGLSRWQSFSSAKFLSYFLWVLLLVDIGFSLYYLFMWIG